MDGRPEPADVSPRAVQHRLDGARRREEDRMAAHATEAALDNVILYFIQETIAPAGNAENAGSLER